jgi:hypothetical protein
MTPRVDFPVRVERRLEASRRLIWRSDAKTRCYARRPTASVPQCRILWFPWLNHAKYGILCCCRDVVATPGVGLLVHCRMARGLSRTSCYSGSVFRHDAKRLFTSVIRNEISRLIKPFYGFLVGVENDFATLDIGFSGSCLLTFLTLFWIGTGFRISVVTLSVPSLGVGLPMSCRLSFMMDVEFCVGALTTGVDRFVRGVSRVIQGVSGS